MNETVDNRIAYQPSPDALAEISVETNNYAADVGNVAGAVISNVIKSGANQFRGNVFEFYRNSDFDANTLGQQPLRARRRPSARSTSSAPRSAARSSRTSCSSSWTTRARSSTSPGAATRVGRPGRLAHRGPLEPPPGHRHQGPRHRRALPEQPDPPEPDQPDRARRSSTARTTRFPNRDVTGVTGNYVGDSLSTDPRPPGRPPARLERVGQRQALPPLLDRGAHDQDGQDGVPAAPPGGLTDAPFRNLGGQLEPRLQLLADQRGPRRLQLDQQRHRR